MKRSTIVGIIAAIIIIIFVVGGYFFFQNRDAQPDEGDASVTTEGDSITEGGAQLSGDQEGSGEFIIPEDGDGTGEGGAGTGEDGEFVDGVNPLTVSRIIDAEVKGAAIGSDDNSLIFFNASSSQFYNADLDGNSQQPLNEQQFVDVEEVVFSPNKTSSIIAFPNENSKIDQKYFYEMDKDLAIKLNENIDTYSFSPDGNQIFYKYADTINDVHTFNISNANGAEWRQVKDFSVSNVSLSWIPGQDKLSFHLTPSSFRQSAYYVFDTDGQNVISILNKGYGVDGLWSRDGSRLLASYAKQRTINLGLVGVNIDGSERISVPNSRTFVQKCVWMNDNVSVICGVPTNLDNSKYIPDEYLEGSIITEDKFYRYNTKTGERVELIMSNIPEGEEQPEIPQMDAHHLFMSSDELTLYFTNAADGDTLWRIRLDQAL